MKYRMSLMQIKILSHVNPNVSSKILALFLFIHSSKLFNDYFKDYSKDFFSKIFEESENASKSGHIFEHIFAWSYEIFSTFSRIRESNGPFAPWFYAIFSVQKRWLMALYQRNSFLIIISLARITEKPKFLICSTPIYVLSRCSLSSRV